MSMYKTGGVGKDGRVYWAERDYKKFVVAMRYLKGLADSGQASFTGEEELMLKSMELAKVRPRPVNQDNLKVFRRVYQELIHGDIMADMALVNEVIGQPEKPQVSQVMQKKLAGIVPGFVREEPADIKKFEGVLTEALAAQRTYYENALLQMEARHLANLNVVYMELSKHWLGNYPEPLFGETKMVASPPEKKFPSDTPKPVLHKKKVLFFGALPGMQQEYEKALPDVEVHVTKDIHRAAGHYDLAIMLVSKMGGSDQEFLKKNCHAPIISVSGGMKAKAIEAVKNHLGLA